MKGVVMANIAQVLKEEVSRIAKKEIKANTAVLKRDCIRLKKDVADLKRRLAAVERDNKLLMKQTAKVKAVVETSTTTSEDLKKIRVTGAMIIKLREKLGLTQNALGQLLGVSGQSVYQYETVEGKLNLRDKTKAALAQVRQMGKREAQKALEDMG